MKTIDLWTKYGLNGLSSRALAEAGIKTVEEVEAMPDCKLRALRWIGYRNCKRIRTAIAEARDVMREPARGFPNVAFNRAYVESFCGGSESVGLLLIPGARAILVYDIDLARDIARAWNATYCSRT